MAKKKKTPKAKKPRKDFPLFPHATGYWAKKVRGKLKYFGKVSTDPKGQEALAKWLDQRDDLLAGRTPRISGDGLTVADLCNRFLSTGQKKLDTGDLAPRTFANQYATCALIVKAFGRKRLVCDLDASDFERLRRSMARDWGPVTVTNAVRRVRSVFRYAEQNRLVAAPVYFGSEFKSPSKRLLRLDRAKKLPRMFEAEQLRAILDAAGTPMKAMVLLGINCGLGNGDIANLPIRAVDLDREWLDFPRPKTGTPRRCPLWPETIAAIREAIDQRPKPMSRELAGLFFITPAGAKWCRAVVEPSDSVTDSRKMWSVDFVGKAFTKLLKTLEMKRLGLGFYAIRHTFATIASGSRDQIAVDYIMGHAPGSSDMSAVYRERIDDSRLVAVVEHVRKWLFRDVKQG